MGVADDRDAALSEILKRIAQYASDPSALTIPALKELAQAYALVIHGHN